MTDIRQLITKPLPWICLVLVVASLGSVCMAKDVAVIRIKYRWARELAPVVQSMLSADGSVTVSERVNSLVIFDNQDYSRRYGQGANTVIFQVVETGFEVIPTIFSDNVLIKIVPRIAYDDDKDAVVRFYGAQTEVTVPFGRWVEIGGVGDQKNEVIREILSRGRNNQTTSMSMLLMAERLE